MAKILVLLLFVSTLSGILCEESNEIIKANNLFTASIYQEILKESSGDNIVFSPFSIATVLALVHSGAKDKTAEEIHAALHLPADLNSTEIDDAFKHLLVKLKTSAVNARDYKFNTANKVYVKSSSTIKEAFLKSSLDIYKAGAENVDFSQSDQAADIINKWVEEQTEEKIKHLVDPFSITADTRAVLVNALHFKGNFVEPFDHLGKSDFYNNHREIVKVVTMFKTSYFEYSDNNKVNAALLKMSFRGPQADLVIALPNDNSSSALDSLENKLNELFIFDDYKNEAVQVELPKFKIEDKHNLKTFLNNLGMKQAFTEEANFSGISDDIYINDVIQKAFIDVDEHGVEAAAATYSDFVTKSAAVYENVKKFKADHPFIFFIRIQGVVIFAGRVVKL